MIVGDEYQRALVQGLGLPVEGCTGARIVGELGEVVELNVTYMLTAEALAKAARIIGEHE